MPPLCKGRWVRFIALGGIVKVPQTSSLRHFWRFSFFAQSRYHRTSSFARKRNSETFSTAYSVSKIPFLLLPLLLHRKNKREAKSSLLFILFFVVSVVIIVTQPAFYRHFLKCYILRFILIKHSAEPVLIIRVMIVLRIGEF